MTKTNAPGCSKIGKSVSKKPGQTIVLYHCYDFSRFFLKQTLVFGMSLVVFSFSHTFTRAATRGKTGKTKIEFCRSSDSMSVMWSHLWRSCLPKTYHGGPVYYLQLLSFNTTTALSQQNVLYQSIEIGPGNRNQDR